ncbi:MAG: hypothetical protein GW941_01615 [Candidatus Pacebacteria bacterium]|nr:hypothetical protein [Candidatus Paceibacterota bacterium]
MPIIKEKYTTIPDSILKSDDMDKLLDCYINEFLNKESNESGFVKMFLNIINDFLDSKINEETLSKLIHKSLFNEKIKKFHYEPYTSSINDIISILHRLLDITWTQKSPNYEEYLVEVQNEFNTLIKKYTAK